MMPRAETSEDWIFRLLCRTKRDEWGQENWYVLSYIIYFISFHFIYFVLSIFNEHQRIYMHKWWCSTRICLWPAFFVFFSLFVVRCSPYAVRCSAVRLHTINALVVVACKCVWYECKHLFFIFYMLNYRHSSKTLLVSQIVSRHSWM